MSAFSRSSSGFSLLEMVITIALLAIILSIAAPSFSDFSQRQAIKSDVQRYTKLLTTARSIAMTTNDAASVVCWNTTGSNVTLMSSVVAVPAQSMVAYSGIATATGLGDLITTQSLTQDLAVFNASEADGCIGFDSQGRVSDVDTGGGPPVTFVFCKASDDDEDSVRIEVAATGRVLSRSNSSTKGAGVQSCS